MSRSVTERVSQMLSSTPTFTGAPKTEIIEASAVTPVFEGLEVTVSISLPVGNRKKQEEHLTAKSYDNSV